MKFVEGARIIMGLPSVVDGAGEKSPMPAYKGGGGEGAVEVVAVMRAVRNLGCEALHLGTPFQPCEVAVPTREFGMATAGFQRPLGQCHCPKAGRGDVRRSCGLD